MVHGVNTDKGKQELLQFYNYLRSQPHIVAAVVLSVGEIQSNAEL